MKILFLTEFFPDKPGGKITGGSESRTYYLARELSNKHEVSIVTALLPQTLKEEKWRNLKILRVGNRRRYLRKMGLLERGIFGLSAVWRIFRLRPDVIDANNGVVYIFGFLAKLITGAKLVYWVPDIVGLKEWQREQGFPGGLIARILELTAVWFPADKIIALSNTTKDKLILEGVNSKIIKVIYPGV